MRVSGSTGEFGSRRRTRVVAAGLAVALVAVSLTQVAGHADATTAVRAAALPVAGAQTSGDSLFPQQGNGGYDVANYDVALAYAASGSITATATITAATTGAPLSSYAFDLEGLTVSSVKVNGVAAGSTRIETTSADTKLDKHKLVITPATPVDGTFTTVVTYSGTPGQHSDPDGAAEGWTTTPTGAVALGQPVGTMTWVPCNNHPGDKATWTTKLTIPTIGLANHAVFNGQLVSKVANPAPALTTTSTWRQPNPMAAELAIVAIGNYQTNSNDSLTLAGGRVVQERSYLNSALAALNENSRGMQTSVINAIQARYGPYPGAATGIVVDSTTLGYALETQDRPYFEGAIDNDTLIHEFAHQWYGDSVSPADWNDIWLNEGPATFIATQVARDLDPTSPDAETTYYGLWNDTAAADAKWRVPPARMTSGAQLFGWQVYNRGAMTLEALRTATCQSVFQQVMAEDQSVNRGTSRPTTDFITRAERVSGRDLTDFFQDWIYDADKPAWPAKYTLGLTSSPAAGSTVMPGSRITYTLTAANTGKVAMTGKVVTVDVTGLSRKATVDPASLPAGVTLTGTTLTWQVPTTAVAATATTTFAVVVGGAAAGATLPLTARSATLGTCDAPTSTLTVAGAPTPSPTTSPTSSQTVTPTGSPTASPTETPTSPTVSPTGSTSPTTPPANRAPTARFTAAPLTVYVGQPLRLDARGSTDPDTGRAGLTYQWDFGNSGSRLDAATATATARYAGRGPRTVRLRVTDAQGASDTMTVPVVVLKRVACEARSVQLRGFRVVQLRRAPGGTYCSNRLAGPQPDVQAATAALVFSGTQLRIGYGKRRDGGTAAVYIDGKRRGTLDFGSAGPAISFPKAVTFRGLGQSNNHRVRVVATSGTLLLDSFSF